MEELKKPQVISGPFAYKGEKNVIPDASTGSYLASVEDGFPPITMMPKGQGGLPPEGRDMNGVLNLDTQFYFYTQNGGVYTFEQEVSDKIGGYPLNAMLWYFPKDGIAKWLRSNKPNNTDNFNTNPDFIGTTWIEENTGFSLGNVGDIKETSRTGDAPMGGVWADGSEYTFSEFPQVGAMLEEGKLRQKSYNDWSAEITKYGETEYFAYDSGTQKFKVPNMPWNGLDGEIFDETTLKVYKRPSRKYVVLYSGVQDISLRDYTDLLDKATQEDINKIQEAGVSAQNVFDANVTEKTSAFNQNSVDKTESFDNNASAKTISFNENVASALESFNSNATNKTNAFDTNAAEKTSAYNANAQEKIDAIIEEGGRQAAEVANVGDEQVERVTSEGTTQVNAATAQAKDAANSATQAASSVSAAKNSEDNAQIWAEGTDEQVSNIGGTHSAKGWAQVAEDVVDIKPASETRAGITRYATVEEATAAEIANAAVTPAGLVNYVNKTSNETIPGAKTFLQTLERAERLSGDGSKLVQMTDLDGRARVSTRAYYTDDNTAYHRSYVENSNIQKHGYLDVQLLEDGTYYVSPGGNATYDFSRDNAFLTRNMIRTSGLTYTGTNAFNGVTNFNNGVAFGTTNNIFATPSGATNEGGEFKIGVGPDYQESLGPNVTVDVAETRFRVFRTGGTATDRVFNFDMLNGWLYYSNMETLAETDSSLKIAPTQWVQNLIASKLKTSITSLSATSGTVSLTTNTVYKMTISGSTTFSLPASPTATIDNQIKLFVAVTGTPTINWGTNTFFNKEIPAIETGNYEVYFDYDPNLNKWVAGALKIGGAE